MNTIDVYLDFTCPYSYIAHHRIAEAIRLNTTVSAHLQYRAFQLNPSLPIAGIPRATYRKNKFGSIEESRRRDSIVVDIASNEGININFDNISITPNTRAAHRAIKISEDQGKNTSDLYDKVFSAYFIQGLDIGDTQVLINLAAELDIILTKEQLNKNGTYIDKIIDKDISDAHSVGLTGVPYAVIKNGTHISITAAVYALRNHGL